MSNINLISKTNDECINLSISKKKRLLIRLIAMICSLIVCLGPGFLISNLFILIDYVFLITLGIAILVYIFLVLGDLFTYIMFKNEKEELKTMKIRYNLLINCLIDLILVAILYGISAIILGVIFVW